MNLTFCTQSPDDLYASTGQRVLPTRNIYIDELHNEK